MSNGSTDWPGGEPQDAEQQSGDQPAPGQQYPGQQYPGQQFPGRPAPGQEHPAQPAPGQQYIGQQFPGQPASTQRRRRNLLLVGGAVLVVLAIVGTLIGVKLSGGHATGGAAAQGSAGANVAKAITTVPASTLKAAGTYGAVPVKPIKGQPVLTSGGKPDVFYIGAEWCPFCAAERWALAVALSRFGTFSGLHFIHSSSTDVYPNTPTLSFYKSSYTSKYLAFSPVEWYSVTHAVLQPPTSTQMALFKKYESPPYAPAADTGSYPFVDIGNQALIIGAQYPPSTFGGKTWSRVAAAIRNPSTTIGKEVGSAANGIIAELCGLTHGQPGDVCAAG